MRKIAFLIWGQQHCLSWYIMAFLSYLNTIPRHLVPKMTLDPPVHDVPLYTVGHAEVNSSIYILTC